MDTPNSFTMPNARHGGKPQTSVVLPISKFPVEIKDAILERMSNAQILPFLFARSTHESAKRALFVGELSIFTDDLENKHLLSLVQQLRDNPERGVQTRTLRLRWPVFEQREAYLPSSNTMPSLLSQLLTQLPKITTLDVEVQGEFRWLELRQPGILPPEVDQIILRGYSGCTVALSSDWMGVFLQDATKDWNLNLVNCYFENIGFHTFSRCPVLRLDISGFDEDLIDAPFHHVTYPRLRDLHINGSMSGNNGMRFILGLLAESKQLERLHLRGCDYPLDDFEDTVIEQFPVLRELTVPASNSLEIVKLLQNTCIEQYTIEVGSSTHRKAMQHLLVTLTGYLFPLVNNFTSLMPNFLGERLIKFVPAGKEDRITVDTLSIEKFHLHMQDFCATSEQGTGFPEIVSSAGKLEVGKYFVIDHSELYVMDDATMERNMQYFLDDGYDGYDDDEEEEEGEGEGEGEGEEDDDDDGDDDDD